MSTDPPKPSRPIDWPAEWWGDEKFWREVATRTVAGVLALLFLGVPTVIWLLATRRLSTDTGVQILIGVGVIVGLVLIYLIIRRILRAVERRRLRKAVVEGGEIPKEQLAKLSDAEFEQLIYDLMYPRRDYFGEAVEQSFGRTEGSLYDKLSTTTKKRLARIDRVFERIMVLVALLLAVAAGTFPFFLRP